MLKILKEKSKLLNLFSYFLVFLITASSIVRASIRSFLRKNVEFNLMGLNWSSNMPHAWWIMHSKDTTNFEF